MQSINRNNIKVGIPACGFREWMGGVTYVEFLVRALRTLPRSEQPKIFLIVQHDERLELYGPTLRLVDGMVLVGNKYREAAAKLPSPSHQVDTLDQALSELDTFFPSIFSSEQDPAAVPWIWDFQYRYMPQYFPQSYIDERDRDIANYAQNSNLIVFSSHDARRDFERWFPGSRAQTEVLHFHACPDEEVFCGDPKAVQERYGLPERFFMCCNQFWMHKNHIRVFEALTILRRQGLRIPLVCTGLKSDGRSPDFFPGLMKLVEEMGISDQIHLLGLLPREDQVQLMRRCLAIVQPSLFEGWSTVVEDGRSLGKSIYLSDLEVHKEQNPTGAIFFDRNDSKDLAKRIAERYPQLLPGPDSEAEDRAKLETKSLVRQYALAFCRIVDKTKSFCEAARKLGSAKQIIANSAIGSN